MLWKTPCTFSPCTYFIHIPSTSTGPIIYSPRSLKYEYELYVEREIEDYKDSVSRGAVLKIGDEAVELLRKQDQIALTELVVWQEVDRIIAKRLRLAGAEREGPALYLAARGCAVTAVEPAEDAVERVVRAAEAAGLTERVRSYCADLGGWAPDVELHAVVCSPTAFAGLTSQDRARVIEVLQSATADGGVHLVETIAAGTESLHDGFPLEELRSRYRGWTISVEKTVGLRETFMARKEYAVA